jgi:tetratricopeptide (TPR) repeat protein
MKVGENMWKSIIIVALLCSSFILSSGNIYSNPNSLIAPPELKEKNTSQSSNIEEITKKFLPAGFEILTKDGIATNKSLEFIDIDNDKNNEIIAFIEKEDTKGFMLLKKKNGLWQKEYQKLLKCEFISKFALLNIFDMNKKSILVGFSINNDIGAEYDAYTYEDDSIKERNMGTWNKLDVIKNLDTAEDKFTIAGWRKYGYDYLIVDFVKFDIKGAYLSNDYYPEYYNKSIEYYNSMLNNMLKYKGPTYFPWYGMMRTEIRSGDGGRALNVLETVNQIKGQFPLTDAIADLLKAQTYIKLNRINEAQGILDIAITKENNDLNVDENYIMGEEYRDLAYMYIENARLFEKLSNKEKAEEMLGKASDIFKNLNEKNYYSNNNMNIYKELDLNTIKDEQSKLDKSK